MASSVSDTRAPVGKTDPKCTRLAAPLLESLTTRAGVGIVSNMKATPLIRRRVVLAPDAFAEVMIWRVPRRLPPSAHDFKYRLAYVVQGGCIIRYDNEQGKGDHRHVDAVETLYVFSTPEQLMADFMEDIARWNSEHGHT
jgi:Family of unknown function (DUF6516)